MVVGRGDLHDVGAGQPQAGQPAQDELKFPGGQPARLRRAGPRGVRRVEHVDVDAHVHRPVTDPLADPVDGVIHAPPGDVGGRYRGEAELAVVAQVAAGVEAAADADVGGAVQGEDALLGRAPERRAVRVGSAKVGVPGVEVRVEVDQRDRAVPRRGGAQQRQRDRVVPADRDQVVHGAEQGARPGLHLADGLPQVERVRAEVPGVGDLMPGPRRHVQSRMVGPQQLGPGPDRRRAEPRTRPVRHAGVERDARDGHRGGTDVGQPRQPREGVGPGEARDGQRVRRPDWAGRPGCPAGPPGSAGTEGFQGLGGPAGPCSPLMA